VDVRDDAGAHDRRATVAKAAAAGALVVVWAIAAWLLLRTTVPDDLVLPHLDPADYFTTAQLDRAARYRTVARTLFLVTTAAQLVVGALVVWRARRLEPRVRRVARGRIRTGIGMAFVTLTVVWVAVLPLGVAGHWWAMRYGLTHQPWAPWLKGHVIAFAVQAVLVCAVVAGVVWLAGRYRRWWLVAGPALAVVGTVFALAQPVVIQPLFTNTKPLPDKRLAAEVQRLGDRIGVTVSTVQVSDASRRTTVPNAMTVGIGPTRRVVFDDTILDGRFSDAELESVAAHELGHVKRRHVWKGVAWFALFLVPGLALVAWATERRGGLRDPALVPLALLVTFAFTLAIGPFANAVSRRYEAEADWISLTATNDPDAAVGLERRLATASLADPDPPAWIRLLYATHPTTMQRIAMAEAYRERARP